MGFKHRPKKRQESYQETLARQEAEAKDVADRIRPVLEKDGDWDLATGKADIKTDEDAGRFLRARTRLTKKAVRLLHPEHRVSVRADRGTAWNWVDVCFDIPRLSRPQGPKTARDAAFRELKELNRRTKDVLVALGIRYSTYLPDSLPGDDERRPCLAVSVNHAS